MPTITFEGKGTGAVKVSGGAEAEFGIERPEEWTEFVVNGRYRVYACRRGKRWEFAVSDPDLGDYIFAADAGAMPPLCHRDKVTLHLPDDAPAEVTRTPR